MIRVTMNDPRAINHSVSVNRQTESTTNPVDCLPSRSWRCSSWPPVSWVAVWWYRHALWRLRGPGGLHVTIPGWRRSPRDPCRHVPGSEDHPGLASERRTVAGVPCRASSAAEGPSRTRPGAAAEGRSRRGALRSVRGPASSASAGLRADRGRADPRLRRDRHVPGTSRTEGEQRGS